mgnify:CR=1 FL=1
MAEDQYLIPLEDYLKAGIHIGTKFRTKHMDKFVYKVRPDGLSVLNVEQINDRLKLAGKLLSDYDPKDIIIVCRRENGWKSVKKFADMTGVKSFIGRYPPGMLTNANLEDFIEAKLILAVDPIPDKNVINDASKLGIPVIALCDSNNESKNIDLVVPCNNKGKKSLGLILYVMAREMLKNKGELKENEELSIPMEKFMED